MAQRENIVAKVTKILAHASGTDYKHEAETALLLAQKLLAEYGLSMADIEAQQDKEKPEVVHIVVDMTKVHVDWREQLASVIAENFRCECYYSKTHSGVKIMFIGLKNDANIAKAAYIRAFDAINVCVKRYLAQRKKSLGVGLSTREGMQIRASYVQGFILGLAEKFKEQIARNCYALVLATPKEVKRELESLNCKAAPRSEARYDGDIFAQWQGVRDGKAHADRKNLQASKSRA